MLGILPDFFKFKVVNGTRLGRACVATKKIKNGEIICKFTGPILDLRQFIEKYNLNDCSPLQIDRDKYIDLIVPYVCFNHSCNPNAGIRNDGVLFALKDIRINEEILYDYSTTADDVTWSMKCECRAAGCRGVIGDFQSIPHARKLFFLSKNAITRHIKETFY